MGRGSEDATDLADEGPARDVASEIDENLRLVYQGLVEDPLPTRFEQLIEQLRQQDGGA